MISLKPVTTNDLPLIEQLARLIWPRHYTPIIGTSQVNYMLDKIYSLPALLKQAEEGQAFYLVRENEKNIGFISISNPGNKNYFLHKFYLLPTEQGKKIGETVFKMLFTDINQAETIRLYVNRQNYKSVNFYFKMGFKIEKLNDLDIGNGYFMNDFVMVWHAKK